MNSKTSFALFLILGVLMSMGFLMIGSQAAIAQDECELTIVKQSNPADDTPFNFSVTGEENFEFTLSDPSDTEEVIGLIALQNGPEGVEVRENVPQGWVLEDIQCEGGFVNCGAGEFVPCLNITVDLENNSINADCLDSDVGTCTFINSAVTRSIPTLSEWGLIAMAGILVLIGIWGITRKKVQA